jgi:hypothetical protein
MSLFELVFGLSAVILGLALTQIVSNFHRLLLAGPRVRWAPEPLLLCGLIFLVIVSVWLTQWNDRNEMHTTIGMVVLQVLKILMPYLAAAFVLPDRIAEEGMIDLYRHYDRTRVFTYGALIAGLLLFWAYYLIAQTSVQAGTPGRWVGALLKGPWLYIALYLVLIFIRARWFNILLLTAALLFYAWSIVPIPLGQ